MGSPGGYQPSSPGPMIITTCTSDGTSVITPSGELDLATVGQLEAALDAAVVAGGVGLVVVRLDRVTFMGAVVIRALLRAREGAAERGATLMVINPTAAVRRVLRAARAEDLLTAVHRDDHRSHIADEPV